MSVAHAYPRWNGDVAGAFIERLFVALQEVGHSVSVVVPADEGQGSDDTQNGIPIKRARYAPSSYEVLAYRGHMADATRSLTGLASFVSLVLTQAWALTEVQRRSPADLVHAHWWVPGGVSAWLACLAFHKRYVVTLHGTDVAVLERSKGARRLARIVLRGASKVTAVSSYLAERAAAVADLDPQDVLVQPMPLDVDRYSKRSGGGGGVVIVGRITEQKNIAVILEAMAILKKLGRELKLKIVGDGPERRSLEYRANQLGIGGTTDFVGAVEPVQIPEAIGDADVLAFPAIGEGLGLVVAEALMLGVPVVAARQGGGVMDLLPSDRAGRVVDGHDAKQFAQAIEALLGDPAARDLAASSGEELRDRLSPSYVARVFESVYLEALSGE